MKKIVTALMCFAGIVPAMAQGGLATTHEESGFVPEGYFMDWHDEFDNGTELNASDWRHEVQGSGWVNHELQNYVNHKSPEGALVTEIKDDALIIRCFKENGKIYSGRVYAHSSKGWTYGYMEARIKLPKGKGTWPAFWMMPVHFTGWPADGEIDIMEEVGYHPNYVSSSLHANAHVHSNGTQVTHEMYCAGAEDDYHIYGIEWTGQKITTYVDGKKQLEYGNRGLGRDDWPYDDPFYLILNLAWGGDWGGNQGVDESALPCEMLVDYVRVYQKSNGSNEPKDNLKIGDVTLDYIGSNSYQATIDFVQGQDYAATGDEAFASKKWYYDPDFFSRNEDGTYKFIAVSGKYQVTASFGEDYFTFVPLDGEGNRLTYDKTTGTGALWAIGNDGFGKPSYAFAGNWGASVGWSPTPEMFVAVPQVSDKVYQLTLQVGKQLRADNVNFKFFHQAGYGDDSSDEFNVKDDTEYHISSTSDLFVVDTEESGNIKVKDQELTDGYTYVLTIDCSDPKNAVLSVVEEATAIKGVSTLATSSKAIYDLQGRRVEKPVKGIYVKNGKKFIVR